VRCALSVCAIWLVMASAPAVAATFTVNTTADGHDKLPGNGVCETGTGNGICTLRAAVEEGPVAKAP
jgi:CSLREA domain-containing protein